MEIFTFNVVQDIINQAIAESIGTTASTITALQNKALIRVLDNINHAFIYAAHVRHHAGGWTWMEGTQEFQTVNDTVLGAALNVGDSTATITIPSAGTWPSAGRFWVRTARGGIDFCDYSSISTVGPNYIVTLSAGPSIPHVQGESVGITYQTPSDFGKMRRVIVNTVEYFFDDRRYLLPYWGSYKLRQNYIVFPQSTTAVADATYWYEKKPSTLYNSTPTNDTTNADLLLDTNIPTAFYRHPVEALKAYIFNVRRKPDLAVASQQLADMELDRALSYDAIETAAFSGLKTNY